jgi:hypothetical protein
MPTHLRTFDPFADSGPFSDSPINHPVPQFNHPIPQLPDYPIPVLFPAYPIQVRPCPS